MKPCPMCQSVPVNPECKFCRDKRDALKKEREALNSKVDMTLPPY